MPNPQTETEIEQPEAPVIDKPAEQPDPAPKKDPAEVESVHDLQPEKPAAGEEAPVEGDEAGHPKGLDGNPRFREVYGRMKKLEREKEEQLKDIDAMRAFNRELASRLGKIEENKVDREPIESPDFREDPEAAKAWVKTQLDEERKKIREDVAQQQRELQVQFMYENYPDYEEVIKIAARDMDRDAELSKKIYSTGNAPRAAYDYAKKKKSEIEKSDSEELDRLSRIKQTRVNGAGEAPPTEGEDEILSEQEMRVVRRLFDDMPLHEAKKRYLAQKKQLGGKRNG